MKTFAAVSIVFALMSAAGCSSSPPVRQQTYAELQTEKTFENDFAVVWKGIEAALTHQKIVERDPEKADDVELKKLTRRTLETDWIYTQSRDKYIEYSVNGFPRKQYLQMRVRYRVIANSVIGGVRVTVEQEEEIERLKSDGKSDGYETMKNTDTSRANDLLEKINLSILSSIP